MKRIFWIFILYLLLLPACKIREFNLPVWDVDIAIPLINEKYYVSELLDTVNIVTDQNDLLHLTTNGHLQTSEIFAISLHPDIDQSVPMVSGIMLDAEVPVSDVNNDVHLSYGSIKSGSLSYQFGNINPAVNMAYMVLADFRSAAGEPLKLNYEDEALHTINLAGFHIGEYNSGEMLGNLSVQLYSESSLPEGTPVGEITIQMQDELLFSFFQGQLNNFVIGADTGGSGIDLEYPLGIEHAITLQEASIQIDVTNQLHFSCKFTGSIRSMCENEVVIIPIIDDNGNPYIIPPATDAAFGQKTLVLHDNISQLLQIMPTHIDIISPQFTIDTSSGFGTLQDTQIIKAEYLVDAPFRFQLHEYPIEIQEVLEISLPEDNRDLIRKNLLDAQLEILLHNKLPLGGKAYAYFSTQEDIDIDDPDTYNFVKSIAIQSSIQNPDWQTIPGLRLTRDELLLFAEEDLYLKWVFSFEATEDVVEIHASTGDYIAIKGSFKGKVRVEE